MKEEAIKEIEETTKCLENVEEADHICCETDDADVYYSRNVDSAIENAIKTFIRKFFKST